ncbi:MAG: YdjY domain-containing protein [Planctomycetaceae bacterium]
MKIRQWRTSRGCLPVPLLTVVLILSVMSDACRADGPPVVPATSASGKSADQSPRKPAGRTVKLPGLVIDLQRRCVDLEAVICLERGFLELIACTKGTKQHESIVAVSARAMHVHTALLLLGAQNGHPAMRQPVDKQKTRWVHVPPRGDPIDVLLVTKGKQGLTVERPISEYIIRSSERIDEVDGAVIVAPGAAEKRSSHNNQDARLPHTFVFAGSHLRNNGDGPRQYLADVSGNVISIATFGDEVLCLPFRQTQEDGALMWHIKPASLPQVGTHVILRLRPRPQPVKSQNVAPQGDGTDGGESTPVDSAVDKDQDKVTP